MKLRTWAHSRREPGSSGPRRTVGVVIDNLVDGYQRILFESIARTAREHGLNLVAFVGGRLPSPLYDSISAESIDALILSSASLTHQVGPQGLVEFAGRFNVPICSIGISLEGAVSIVPDGIPGVAALVTHLLADHGKRELACIRGPGADGKERFDTFRRTLEEFGVQIKDELVVVGDFTESSGAEAIRILCDERKVRFNAVVAGNDYMALGAIAALEERDLSVPGDIAVVGFDDIEDARHAAVPLTTVRQPIRELGKRAVQAVISQLDKTAAPELISIACHPLKRRSCGCVVESPFTRRPASSSRQFADPEAALSARRDLVVADMSRTAQGELGNVGYEWEQKLFDAVQDELRGGGTKPFLTATEQLARRVFRAGGDASTWQRVLATLRHHVLECVGSNLQHRATAENAFYDALLLSTNVVGREEAHHRKDLERRLGIAVKTSNRLMTSIDSEQLGKTLTEHLGSLGIPSCYVSLYTDDSRSQARLVVGYDAELPTSRQEDEQVFNVTSLVPRNLLPADRSFAYVLAPLSHQDTHLGFALFEYRANDGALISMLSEQLGSALKAVALRD